MRTNKNTAFSIWGEYNPFVKKLTIIFGVQGGAKTNILLYPNESIEEVYLPNRLHSCLKDGTTISAEMEGCECGLKLAIAAG